MHKNKKLGKLRNLHSNLYPKDGVNTLLTCFLGVGSHFLLTNWYPLDTWFQNDIARNHHVVQHMKLIEELKHNAKIIRTDTMHLIALTGLDFVHVYSDCVNQSHISKKFQLNLSVKFISSNLTNAVLISERFSQVANNELLTGCVHFGEDVRQKRCDCILNSSGSSRDKLWAGWAALRAISLRLGENSRLSAPDHTLIKVCVSPAVCLQASLLVK